MGLDDLLPDVLTGDSPAQQRIREGFSRRGAFGGALNAISELPSLGGDIAGAAQDFLPGIGDLSSIGSAITGSVDGFELTGRQRLAAAFGGSLGLLGVSKIASHHAYRRGEGEAGHLLFGPSQLHAFPGKTGVAADPRFRNPDPRGQIILDTKDFGRLAEILGAPKLQPIQRSALAGFFRAYGERLASQVESHRERRSLYNSPEEHLIGSATVDLSKFDNAIEQNLFKGESTKTLLETYEELRHNPIKVIGEPDRLEPLLKFMVDFADVTQDALTPELHIAPHVSLYGIEATPEGPRVMVHYAAEALPTRVDEMGLRDRLSRWDYEKSIPHMVENLLKLKGLTRTPEELADDLQWYPRAHTLAQELSAEHGISLAHAAGVLSAFSPQTEWGDNVRFAREFLTTHEKPQGATVDNFNKAVKVMQDEGTREAVRSVFSDAKTLKTLNFFENIYNPHNKIDFVTVDSHQFDAALGFRVKGRDDGTLPRDAKGKQQTFKAPIFEKQAPGSRAYEAIATAHRLAAQIEGLIETNKLQAATWKEMQGLKEGPTRPLPEGSSGPGEAGKRTGRFVVSDNIWNAIHGRSSPTLAELIRNASDDDAPDVAPPPGRDKKPFKNLSPGDGIVVVSEPNGLVSVLGKVTDVAAESTRTLYPLPIDNDALALARWVPLRPRVVDDADDLVGTLLSDESLSQFPVLERHTDPTGYPALATAGNHFVLKAPADKRAVLDLFESEAGQTGVRHAGIVRQQPSRRLERLGPKEITNMDPADFRGPNSPLRTHQWVGISADLKKYTDAERRQRYADLGVELRRRGYHPIKSDGHYGGHEPSYIVFGMLNSEAIELGKMFGQESVVTPDGLFYSTGEKAGTANPATGQLDFGQPDDYYTELTVGGERVRFQQGLDFDTSNPVTDANAGLRGETTQEALHIELGDNPDPELVERLWTLAEKIRKEDGVAVNPTLYLHGGGLAPAGATRVVEHHFADARGKGHVMHRGLTHDLGNENGVFAWIPEDEAQQYKPSKSLRFKAHRGKVLYAQSPDGSYVVDNELRLFVPGDAKVVLSAKGVLVSSVGTKTVRSWALQLSDGSGLPIMAIGRNADEVEGLMADAGANPGRMIVGSVTKPGGKIHLTLEAPSRRLGLEAVATLRRAGTRLPAGSFTISTVGQDVPAPAARPAPPPAAAAGGAGY